MKELIAFAQVLLADEEISPFDLGFRLNELLRLSGLSDSQPGGFSGARPRPAGAHFACYFCIGGSTLKDSTMNRRSACICFIALLKTTLVSSFALAAQEAGRTVSRITGPRWNVNGDWAPSLEEIQGHLRAAHGIDPGNLGIEDLLTLHDNDHNRSGHTAGHGHKKAAKSSAKGYAKF